MSKYTSFTITLSNKPRTDWQTERPYYVVTVSSTGTYMEPVRCEGTSIRSAYIEAIQYIDYLVARTCEDCGETVPEGDETFSACGICLPCYDRMMAKR